MLWTILPPYLYELGGDFCKNIRPYQPLLADRLTTLFYLPLIWKLYIGVLSAVLGCPFVIFVELLQRNSRKWNKNVFYWEQIKKKNKKNLFSMIIFSLSILCMSFSVFFVLVIHRGSYLNGKKIFYQSNLDGINLVSYLNLNFWKDFILMKQN